MTVSWGGTGVLWGKMSYTSSSVIHGTQKEFIDNDEFFSLSFLSEKYRDALNFCGSHSGRDCDKFKEAGLTVAHKHNIPFPDESNFVLLCRKMVAVPITKETFTDKEISCLAGMVITICTQCMSEK